MKNLLNFFSKRENTTETKPTTTSIVTPKVELEPVTFTTPTPAPKRESKKWNGVKKAKYVYNAEELSELLMSSILTSYNKVLNKRGVYFLREEKHYTEENGFFTTTLATYKSALSDSKTVYKENNLNYFGISKERYKTSIMNLSKKDKKRFNNLISKLNLQPDNSYRFIKLLNTVESKIGNINHYSLGNRVEEEIELKRRVFRDIVKHIKMDLPVELKKAKAEYIKAKGDFYKTK
jgi:hypothetical protein